MSQKLVVVFGGTGNLGSSVALSLHKNPEFAVCVLSRDAGAAKARSLSSKGIEVVTANNWKPHELALALGGAWAIFINIDSDNPEENWKAGKSPTEFDMGKIIVDAAVTAGVKHIVHASLPYSSKLTNGQVSLISFDDKARISEYILEAAKQQKIETGTIVNAGWFLEDAFDPKYVESFGGFAKRVDDEGYLTWKTPRMGNEPESVPWLAAADDYGDLVHGVLLDPEEYNGRFIDGVSESMGFAELTSTFQSVTGRKARYVAVEGGSLSAGSATKKQEVNGLFDLMHALQGNFFNGRPTEHETSRKLKQRVGKAVKGPETLMSAAEFFRKYAL